MKLMLKQVFGSGKFVIGFVIFLAILLTVVIYPIFVPDAPLKIISRGTFLSPGIYVNLYDSIDSATRYTLITDDAEARRVAGRLSDEDRAKMREWLIGNGVDEAEIDGADTAQLLDLWELNFDPTVRLPGMTNADRNYYIRLTASLEGLLSTEGATIASTNPETGALEQSDIVNQTDYVHVNEVANSRLFILGTDNFGRDVLTGGVGTDLLVGGRGRDFFIFNTKKL